MVFKKMVYKKLLEADDRNCVVCIVALTEVFGVLDSISVGVLRHACCF